MHWNSAHETTILEYLIISLVSLRRCAYAYLLKRSLQQVCMAASVALKADVLNSATQSRGGTNRIPDDQNESDNLFAIKRLLRLLFSNLFFFFFFTSDTGVDERRTRAGDHGPQHQR